jgi:MFS family permease
VGETVIAPTSQRSLRGTGFWWLWLNAAVLGLVVSADRFAFIWLVEDVLGSPTWASGLIVFALGAPVCAFVLTAGAMIDRHDRRRIMMSTQALGTAVLSVAAVLVWTGVMSLGVAVIVAVSFGCVVAFALPVRSALVPVLVGPANVMHAVVVMTVGANIAMIAGPLLVGGVIDSHGVGWAFATQAGCFALGLFTASRLVIPPHEVVERRPSVRTDIAEALGFIWHHPELRALFALLCVGGGLLGGGSFTLLPRIARDHFGQSADDAARLFALVGLGMVTTSLVLIRYRSRLRRRGLIFMGFMVVATTDQILQGLAPSFLVLQVLLFVWGLNGGLYLNLNQSLIQELTPLARMGRVMALNALVNAGLLPLGGLVAGVLASFIGPRPTLCVFGAAGLVCAVVALRRAHGLRRLA